MNGPSGPSPPFGDPLAPARFGPYSASAKKGATKIRQVRRKGPKGPKGPMGLCGFEGDLSSNYGNFMRFHVIYLPLGDSLLSKIAYLVPCSMIYFSDTMVVPWLI